MRIKIITYFGRFLLGLSGLILLLMIFTQTRPFKAFLLNIIIRQTSGILINTELSVERLEGTLFRNIRLYGVNLIHEENDTLFSLDELSAVYKLLPLFKKSLVIKNIEFLNPTIHIEIKESGLWNIPDIHIVSRDTTEDLKERDNNKSFMNNYNIDRFLIENGKIFMSGFKTGVPIPVEIRELNLSGSYNMEGDSIQSDLTTFRFRTINPDFIIKNMNIQLTQSRELHRNISLIIQTALSQVSGMAETDTLSSFPLSASLKANPLALEEFRGFLADDFPLITLPEISFTLNTARDKGNMNLKIMHENQFIRVNIKSFSITPEPVYKTDLYIQNLNLATWFAEYLLQTDLNLNLVAEGSGIDPKTLRTHITADFKHSVVNGYNVEPGKLELRKELDELIFNLNYRSTFGHVCLDGKLVSLFNIPSYVLTGNVKGLDPSKFLPESFPESDINLSFKVQGKGFTPEDLNANVQLKSYQSHIGDIVIDTVNLSFEYKNESLLIRSGILSNSLVSLKLSGYADFKGKTDIRLEIEPGDLNKLASFFNIAPVSASGSIYGNLTGRYPELQLKTRLQLHDLMYDEMTLADLKGSLDFQYRKSLLSGELDLSLTNLRMDKYVLDQIRILSKGNQNELFNTISASSKDINLYLETIIIPDSVSELHIPQLTYQMGPFLVETTHSEGKIFWDKRSFYMDNIGFKAADSDIGIQGLFHPGFKGYNDFEIRIMNFSLDALDTLQILPYPIKGNVSINIQGQGTLTDPNLKIASEIQNLVLDNSSPGNLTLLIELADGKSGIEAQYSFNPQEKIEGTFYFPFVMDPYPVIPFEDSIKATIKTNQLNLSHLNTYQFLPYSLKGQLSASVILFGNLKNPQAAVYTEVENITVDELQINKISMNFYLKENNLNSSFLLEKTAQERIIGTASIPFYLFPEQDKNWVPPDEPVNIDLSVKDLNLKFFEPFSDQIRHLQGYLNLDLQMRNTINDPHLSGEITLNQGRLVIPKYGLDYPEVRMKTLFNGRQVLLEEFFIRGGDGDLVLSGNTVLSESLFDGVESFDFRAKAKQFTAANSKDIFMLTDMDINLKGTPDEPVYNGKLQINRGRLNLDAIQVFSGESYDANAPLLVQARKEVLDTTAIIHKVQSPGFMDNLTGKLTLTIPRNTWIRNKNMNIELGGNLDLLKNNKNFEIYGTVRTLRGFYEQYGRKFDIKEGNITFEGGSDINPILNISITHSFRDFNRVHKILNIKLNGRMNNPTISFLLNDEDITEVDAVSYLLFGRSSQEITQGEQNEVNRQTESGLAKSLIARQLGMQLTGEIGKRLDLDVVEFAGGEDWKQASLYIGKYITDRLFLSYEKDFVIGQTREIVPDRVSAEYELNRNIFIQATRGDESTSGFDIFWKFNKQ